MSIKRTNRDFNLSVAKQLIEDGGTLIDVRTWSEFCSGHICGAHIVPTPLPDELERNPKLLKIFGDKLRTVTKYKRRNHPIIVYCKKGFRADRTRKILESFGFKNVVNLGGVEAKPLKTLIARGGNDYLKICKCSRV